MNEKYNSQKLNLKREREREKCDLVNHIKYVNYLLYLPKSRTGAHHGGRG